VALRPVNRLYFQDRFTNEYKLLSIPGFTRMPDQKEVLLN